MSVTARPFVAREYGAIMTTFLLDTPRAALFADMGLGKTVSTLNALDGLMIAGDDAPKLVLGPLRVARDVWRNEAAKWQHLKYLRVSPIVGTPAERRQALHAKADIYTTNYEQLPWLIETIGERNWPFRTVVADESPRLKGFRLNKGGKRATALGLVARQTERWINLTGTPAANGLKDLWGQFWFMDFGQRLGRTYTAFMERWFSKGFDGYSVKPHPYAEQQIYEAIADVTLSMRARDWFDLAEPIENIVRVQLPEVARRHYRELETKMYTELACGTQIEVFNAAALTQKCLQAASGAVYTTAPEWKPLHDRKLEALDSIVCEAAGAPILVAYEFQSDKARILKAFGDRAVDISTPTGERAFRAGEVQVGVAHPKSMGHGIDGLQDVCNRLVYFGHNWDLEQRQQILERIGPVRQMQSGLDRPVYVTSIVADDTLDDTVLERHASKRGVQDLLMEAMTRREI